MNKYTFGQRLLHRVALSSRIMRQTCFEIEKSSFLQESASPAGDPVFVTGLARAGTTVLLEAIYSSNEFASMTYSDMPFVMAPNLWGKVKKGIDVSAPKTERAHRDGIMINLDSPEAFEEVFWQSFSEQEGFHQFENYVRLVLYRYQKCRYLSKNNQNVHRISMLQELFPCAKVLIVFKDPVNHAMSLLNQHLQFSKIQGQDSFVKDYMDLIKHSEFGLSYTPIMSENLKYRDPSYIEHWLEQWYLLYDNLISLHGGSDNVVFVNGGLLHGDNSWNKICSFLYISDTSYNFVDMRRSINVSSNDAIRNNCLALLDKLNKIAI